MAEYTADFEAGINGNTITTGAGEASATAWTRIFGTHVYDNTHVAHGTLAAKMNSSADFGLIWDKTFDSELYGRLYLYATANPAADTNVVRLTGGGVTSFIVITTLGKVRSQVGADQVNGSVSIALNQWIRIEYHFITSATVGLLEIKLFNTKESATPDEVIASTANRNTGSSAPTELDHANGNVTSGWGGNIWFDSIITNATDWIGPAVEQDEHARFAGPQLLAGTAATVYTTPASGARIDTVHVSNPSGSPVDFTLSIGTDAAGTRLWDGYSIPADSVWERQLYLPLANGEIVQSFASTAGVLVLTLDGKTL